jgi:elongation factor Ts
VVKQALEKYDGDPEKALIFLREKGLAKALKRAEKRAANGLIVSYIHGNGSLGVLLELNSETDFAAKSEKFQELAHEIALQIAANNPEYIAIENIAEVMEERRI